MSAAEFNDGGPAFPVADFDGQTFNPGTVAEMRRLLSGMALRDYFAAKAMQGMLAFPGTESCGSYAEASPAVTAAHAYAMADAMLAERAKRGGQ